MLYFCSSNWQFFFIPDLCPSLICAPMQAHVCACFVCMQLSVACICVGPEFIEPQANWLVGLAVQHALIISLSFHTPQYWECSCCAWMLSVVSLLPTGAGSYVYMYLEHKQLCVSGSGCNVFYWLFFGALGPNSAFQLLGKHSTTGLNPQLLIPVFLASSLPMELFPESFP